MEIIHLTEENFNTAVGKAVKVLKKGGLVVFPTDTQYGLAAAVSNVVGIARLRELKGREKKKPTSIIVPNIDAISEYAEVSPLERALAERHLPGALTLVLPATKQAPASLTLFGTIGIRVPNDPFALALAKTLGEPYTATSANRAGLPTPSTVHDILMQFGSHMPHVDLAIDDGPRAGTPSTVVKIIDNVPYILRQGAIPAHELGVY